MCPARSALPIHGLAWQEQSMEIISGLLMPISKPTQVRGVPGEGSLHSSYKHTECLQQHFMMFVRQLGLGSLGLCVPCSKPTLMV